MNDQKVDKKSWPRRCRDKLPETRARFLSAQVSHCSYKQFAIYIVIPSGVYSAEERGRDINYKFFLCAFEILDDFIPTCRQEGDILVGTCRCLPGEDVAKTWRRRARNLYIIFPCISGDWIILFLSVISKVITGIDFIGDKILIRRK